MWEVYVAGGRAGDRQGRAGLGARGRASAGRGRSCSPRWTATGPRTATTSRSRRRSSGVGRRARDRLGRGRRAGAHGRGPAGGRGRRPRRLDLPLRRALRRRGQGRDRRRRASPSGDDTARARRAAGAHARRRRRSSPAPRFGAAIGREVWIKRDDIGSIGYAGNKIRKLEYLAPRARGERVDTLLIVGARQSNAARATAAYAAATGRRCVLVVPAEPPDAPPPAEGNALLSGLFGAEFHHVGAVGWAEAEAACAELAAELERDGARCAVLPAGCSSPRGALGFVAAHARAAARSSARGGARRRRGRPRVELLRHRGGPPARPGAPRRPADRERRRRPPLRAGRGADPRPGRRTPPRSAAATTRGSAAADLGVTYDFIGDGYAQPTRECLEAIRLLAATEGIVCDPVYSGKALAAVASVPGRRPGRVLAHGRRPVRVHAPSTRCGAGAVAS